MSSHPGEDVMETRPCYLYGVMGDGGPGDFTAHGLRDQPVEIVRYEDLAALVSLAPAEGCPVTRPNVVAHQLVLDAAMRNGAVLPMRFGVVAPDARTVRDQFLRAQAARLRDLLALVAGKVELVVKASWAEQSVFQEIVAANPEIRALRDAIVGRPEPDTRATRIALGQMVEADLRVRRDQDSRRILDVLAPLAHDVKNGKNETEMMVLNAAFLVGTRRQDAFDTAVDALREAFGQRLAFRSLGPLPPYSFVSMTLEVDR
jgi:hypothetical protein